MGFQIAPVSGDGWRRLRRSLHVGGWLAAASLLPGGTLTANAADASNEGLQLSLGAGVYQAPRFPGARSDPTRLFPYVDAEYDNRYYSNAADLIGVYAWKSDTFQAGAAIAFDPSERPSRDDPKWQHLRSLRSTARLKLFASRTIDFVTFEGNVATDMLGQGEGTLGLANLWFTAPLGEHVTLNAGPGVTWADARYMKAFYAVSPPEASVSPLLQAYSTHSGLLDSHVNGLAEWQVGIHYRIGVQMTWTRLRPAAANSPLTEQRSQYSLVGWVAYTF